MTKVTLELDQNIAYIALQNGKVNAISHQVIDELNAALDKAEQAKAVVVFTGQPGMFSGGFDLNTMHESIEAAVALVHKGSLLSRRMLSFPYPVIAACSGHAIAKGVFLLLSCDYRIGCSGPFKIGLNEVAIGMTMHNAGVEIVRGRLAPNYFNRSVVNAEIYDPETAVAAGILDMVVEPEQLQASAKKMAEHMKTLDIKAHYGTKLRVRAPLLKAIDAAIEIDLQAAQ